jgi:hypothetical protein
LCQFECASVASELGMVRSVPPTPEGLEINWIDGALLVRTTNVSSGH